MNTKALTSSLRKIRKRKHRNRRTDPAKQRGLTSTLRRSSGRKGTLQSQKKELIRRIPMNLKKMMIPLKEIWSRKSIPARPKSQKNILRNLMIFPMKPMTPKIFLRNLMTPKIFLMNLMTLKIFLRTPMTLKTLLRTPMILKI